MIDHLFIAYSRLVAGDFAMVLANALQTGSRSCR
jgi:hypothetical protein